MCLLSSVVVQIDVNDNRLHDSIHSIKKKAMTSKFVLLIIVFNLPTPTYYFITRLIHTYFFKWSKIF